jgi:L-Ala-D/L-Glu epimerase
MRISRLTTYLLRLPLRQEIKHASAARDESVNLLVSCRLADGTIGWGEGVPREYVTGETPEGSIVRLRDTAWHGQLDRDCHGWSDVIDLCDSLNLAGAQEDPRGCSANAARCAVELSILDAFGRSFGEPVSQVTRRFEPAQAIYQPRQSVRYSGAVTASSPRKERISALKMRIYGFRDCKVKVGIGDDEAKRMAVIRRWLGRRAVIRIDANEAWSPEETVAKVRSLEPYKIASVEQPVSHENVGTLRDVRSRIGVPIMLDESLTSVADAEDAIRNGTCDLFNIRLSKCGGFLNSLRLAAMADAAGLGYQLGCHPGESGILSAAGRHWATTVKGIRFLEGSYDRHLLKRLLTVEDITFGYGGRAPALDGPGLGITVDDAALAAMADKRDELEIS